MWIVVQRMRQFENIISLEYKKTLCTIRAGDHDREGRMFVLEEDEAKVVKGEMRPRPLVIRANKGDCVEVTLENHLYDAKEPNCFPFTFIMLLMIR